MHSSTPSQLQIKSAVSESDSYSESSYPSEEEGIADITNILMATTTSSPGNGPMHEAPHEENEHGDAPAVEYPTELLEQKD